jgi:Ran-binding protein 3
MTPPTSMRRESPQPSEAISSSDRMAGDSPNPSDGESGEKPVREKLRDATIGGQARKEEAPGSAHVKTSNSDEADGKVTGNGQGRMRRKRSFEDVDADDGDVESVDPSRHVRKRSREAISGSDIPITSTSASSSDAPLQNISTSTNGSRKDRTGTPDTSSDPMDEEELQKAGLTSPKNKRTRDQVLREEEASANTVEALPTSVAAVIQEEQNLGSEKTDSDEERRTKRSRDSGSPQAAGQTEFALPAKAEASATKVCTQMTRNIISS